MIDMHAHCLPAMDDGAKTEDMAIRMLTEAKRGGTDTVVATPHARVYDDGEIASLLAKRKRAYEALLKEAQERKAEIPEIRLGFEVYLDADITICSDFRKLCIEGTDCMLVELPMRYWDELTFDRLESLKKCGITPILAHLERYRSYQNNVERALSLTGVHYQVNADSFLHFRSFSGVKKIIKSGKFCVAGSDMHDPAFRKSRMKEACEKAERYGMDYQAIFRENARLILSL